MKIARGHSASAHESLRLPPYRCAPVLLATTGATNPGFGADWHRFQLLFLSVTEDRTGLLSSFDPDTGEVLWEYRDYHQKIPIPAPTLINQNSIFLTGGYDAGSILRSQNILKCIDLRRN